MSSVAQALNQRVVGFTEEVSADKIVAQLDTSAPQATALNTGVPSGFPRINGYVLVPNESGATVCMISSVRIVRLPYPKRKGTQKDFGLVDLPFPSRMLDLIPLGTLRARREGREVQFEVRRGVDVFPAVGDPVTLPSSGQLRAIVEGESRTRRVHLGDCPTAGSAPVYVDPDKLFGRHLAILGNTGSGKSCTVAGLVRWSLEAAQEIMRVESDAEGEQQPLPNARFIILDPNGEYSQAFSSDFDVRVFRVQPEDAEGEPLKIPAWLWSGEEWAAFTEASPGVQRPILFEALRRLRAGGGMPDGFEARACGRLKRYKYSLQIEYDSGSHHLQGRRENVAELLLNLENDFLSLASDSNDRNLSEVLREIAEMAHHAEREARSRPKQGSDGFWHTSFEEEQIEEILVSIQKALDEISFEGKDALFDEDAPVEFAIEELPDFVEALAMQSPGRDVAQFVETLNLRIRGLLARGRLGSIIGVCGRSEVRLEDWLNSYIGANQASNGPIAIVDLSLVPSEIVHITVSVLARMIFEAIQRYRRKFRRELPTNLILEEAHTFIHRDMASESSPLASRVCNRIFEKIAREGRKFGLGLLLASQRPSEISPTVLSQCNTFLLHRLVNNEDQRLIRRLVPDGLGGLLGELPSLPTRRAILMGWAAPSPVLIEVNELAECDRPHSPDPAFWEVWTGSEERAIDWPRIVAEWQNGDL